MSRQKHEDAERSLLGAVLIDQSCLDVLDIEPEHFYVETHRHIWRAMLELHARGAGVDRITVTEQLHERGLAVVCGAPNSLAMLEGDVPSAANADYYATIICRRAGLRQLQAEGRAIADEVPHVTDYDAYAYEVTRRIERAVGIGQSRALNLVSSREATKGAFQKVERACSAEEQNGLATGFVDLDMHLGGGWQPGDLIILAARPAMGKSLLLGQMAMRASAPSVDDKGVDDTKHSLIVSCEMDAAQWAWRQMVGRARADAGRIKRGLISEKDWSALIEAMGHVSELSIDYLDHSGIHLTEVIRAARKLAATPDVELAQVGIDYLQRIRAPGRDDREEAATVSKALKDLARELKIPVVALAQLNRDCEARADKRPISRDLRATGQIEQDADVIAFLYRDEVYHEDSDDKGIAELIFAKHREGDLGTVRLRFDGARQRFDSLAHEVRYGYGEVA